MFWGWGAAQQALAKAFQGGHRLQTHRLVLEFSFSVSLNRWNFFFFFQTESYSEPQDINSHSVKACQLPSLGQPWARCWRDRLVWCSGQIWSMAWFCLVQELRMDRAGQRPGAAVLFWATGEGAEPQPLTLLGKPWGTYWEFLSSKESSLKTVIVETINSLINFCSVLGVARPKSQTVMPDILQHPRESSSDIAAVRPVKKPRLRRLRKVPWAAQAAFLCALGLVP